jgi:hypothetical protein
MQDHYSQQEAEDTMAMEASVTSSYQYGYTSSASANRHNWMRRSNSMVQVDDDVDKAEDEALDDETIPISINRN